ncbi:L,D-transpeptidase family protein [Streptomyces sp. NPDC020875]|uniref:L,D-transpeptidase family protein n=1 Tax=Streptomyces sp. NPDC020875 TaxID=3154898 RepID=UPI0033FFB977
MRRNQIRQQPGRPDGPHPDTSGQTTATTGGAAARRGARGRAPAGTGAAAIAVAALLAGAVAPAAAATGPGTAGARAAECTAGTGPYQRALEEYLKRPVDGAQSAEDCAAIRGFQTANGIDPADGYADLETYRTMVAVKARANPNAAGKCPVRAYRVTCVDLDRQLLWVQKNKKVVFDPVPIRTGRDSEETRLGWHTIYWRSRDHVSTIYDDAPMPYAQFFDGGQALHGRLGNLYDGGGSAGCVNLRLADAAGLWDLLAVDDSLYIWGTKPGTAG